MPYRALPHTDRCRYCRRETNDACVRCAHFVCEDCRERHDAEDDHKTYTG